MAATFARGSIKSRLFLVLATLQQFRYETFSLDDPVLFLVHLLVLRAEFCAVSNLSPVHTIKQRRTFLHLLFYTQLIIGNYMNRKSVFFAAHQVHNLDVYRSELRL